jgi:hypothetical protein
MTHPKRKEGAKQNDWDIEDLSFIAFSQYVFFYNQLLRVRDHEHN